ncbi:unnamed protein product [Mycena citricolor]|uniref:Uncharacterized protein n=1 Tax=Mycena citricolor TaxID=2018698 RepID=A0AAD2K0W8_9AGAR|nr:unnamed protein product [Mycena citricolor]
MAPNRLNLLKKGLSALQKHITKCKEILEDHLQRKERINKADSNWLDGPANLVDEQQALELLEKASDYEQGLSQLSAVHKAAVQHLVMH